MADQEINVLSSATILCPSINYGNVLSAVRSGHPKTLTVDGPEESWTRLVVECNEGAMNLTSLIKIAPGDKFSKLFLSMHNFFFMTETDAPTNKALVLNRIENMKMMIGIIGDPEFSETDTRLDCLWRVVEEMDAVVFNGDSMLNVEGQRILSKKGEFDFVA